MHNLTIMIVLHPYTPTTLVSSNDMMEVGVA